MIQVEAVKAEKETQKKKKAYQNAEKTYNTKKGTLEQMEEAAFAGKLSDKEMEKLEGLRNEFEGLATAYTMAKEENDAKEKESRNKTFDKAQRDRDNFKMGYEEATQMIDSTKIRITDMKTAITDMEEEYANKKKSLSELFGKDKSEMEDTLLSLDSK